MNLKDRKPSLNGWQIHHDLPVEPPRTRQSRVEHVNAIRRRHHDNARILLEAIHLGEHGVQRLLAFVVPATDSGKARPPDSIDFVDKENARRILLGLRKHIANATCPHADEHLYEVRATDAEEGHIRFSGDGFREQGLTGPRRSHQEHALGHFSAHALVTLGVFQEVDNLLHFLFRLVHSGNVFEADGGVVLIHQLGAGLAKRKRTALPATHLAHREEIEE